MHRLPWIAGLILMAISARAQYAGFSLLADTKNFRAQFGAAAQNTSSMQSDFIQEKNLSMLSEKIVSNGKFWFKREDKVRMEYEHPFSYLMILSGGQVYVKDGQKENKVSSGSSKVFQQINRIIIDCVKGSALSNTDFSTRIFANETAFLVELTPLAKNLATLFSHINITIDKKNYTASAIDMREASGDNTFIRFTNKELNKNIPDALFTIH